MKVFQKSIWLLMLFTFAVLTAGEKNDFSYPQSGQGRRMAAYFAAFAAAVDTPMETFLRENFSADALRRDSVAQRLIRFRNFKKQARSLDPEKILREENLKISLLARDGQGQWLEFTFVFEKNQSHPRRARRSRGCSRSVGPAPEPR
jgi:hypothetical protein